MKSSVSTPVIIAVIVAVIAIAVGVGMVVSRPKGVSDAQGAVAQSHKGPLPTQPFIPKEGGGRVSPDEAGAVLGQTPRAPVVQGSGNVPQQTVVPGAR